MTILKLKITFMKASITLLAMLSGIVAIAAPHGVVNVSAAYLHSRPDFEASTETQELMGEVVEILERDGQWLKVRCSQPYEAWTSSLWITETDEDGVKEWTDAPKYIFTAMSGYVFAAPNPGAATICDLVAGDVLRKCLKEDKSICRKGWTKVGLPDGRSGWVEGKYVEDKTLWDNRCLGYSKEDRIASAIAWAEKTLGTPYLWGGMTTKAFDCSGLTRFCYLMAGTKLPRNASQQIKCGRRIPIKMMPDGSFDLSALKAGDLVFFGRFTDEGGDPSDTQCQPKATHVGLYIGDGHIIHSSHLVRINSLVRGEADCYENVHRLVGACRIVE